MLVNVFLQMYREGSASLYEFLNPNIVQQISFGDGALRILMKDGRSFTLSSMALLQRMARIESDKTAAMLYWDLCQEYDERWDDTHKLLHNTVQEIAGFLPEKLPFIVTDTGFSIVSHPSLISSKPNVRLKDVQGNKRIQVKFIGDDANTKAPLNTEITAIDTGYLSVVLPFSSARAPLFERLRRIVQQ